MDTIRKLAGTGMTMAVVMHEMGFAKEICNQIVFMVEGKNRTGCSSIEIFQQSPNGPGAGLPKQGAESLTRFKMASRNNG